MMRKEYCLNVSYKGKLYFDESIRSPKHMDNVIEKKLHKRLGGAGMGLWPRATRDLSFYYRSLDEALKGQKIAKKIKGVVSAEVGI